jgi:hypothetical protein
MRAKLSMALMTAALLFNGTAQAAPIGTPAAAAKISYFADALWNDSDAHRHIMARGEMPVPDAATLQRAGMVRVREVERDQGRIAVEGNDQLGRPMNVTMDVHARYVLAVEVADDLFGQRRNRG